MNNSNKLSRHTGFPTWILRLQNLNQPQHLRSKLIINGIQPHQRIRLSPRPPKLIHHPLPPRRIRVQKGGYSDLNVSWFGFEFVDGEGELSVAFTPIFVGLESEFFVGSVKGVYEGRVGEAGGGEMGGEDGAVVVACRR